MHTGIYKTEVVGAWSMSVLLWQLYEYYYHLPKKQRKSTSSTAALMSRSVCEHCTQKKVRVYIILEVAIYTYSSQTSLMTVRW